MRPNHLTKQYPPIISVAEFKQKLEQEIKTYEARKKAPLSPHRQRDVIALRNIIQTNEHDVYEMALKVFNYLTTLITGWIICGERQLFNSGSSQLKNSLIPHVLKVVQFKKQNQVHAHNRYLQNSLHEKEALIAKLTKENQLALKTAILASTTVTDRKQPSPQPANIPLERLDALSARVDKLTEIVEKQADELKRKDRQILKLKKELRRYQGATEKTPTSNEKAGEKSAHSATPTNVVHNSSPAFQ